MPSPILIHPDNVGRTVQVRGKTDQIAMVIASKEGFRIDSEENGPVVNDYSFTDVERCSGLTVSFDGGQTWKTLSI